jgi:hypothetical protein
MLSFFSPFLFAFNTPTVIYRDKLTYSVSRLFIILLYSVFEQSTCFGYKKINLAVFLGSDVESQYLLRNEHYFFFIKFLCITFVKAIIHIFKGGHPLLLFNLLIANPLIFLVSSLTANFPILLVC